jgi:ubiquitin-conjugating enzyme E2 D/E
MNNACIERIQREYCRLQQNPLPFCSAGPLRDDNLTLWRATITGPEKSVYEGGIFNLEIRFPENYPYRPPKIRFLTKIFHCNIGRTGSICLDILKDQWSPVLTISKILISIISLLDDPEPSDPLSPEVSDLYLNNKEEHDRTARQWTLQYATGIECEENPPQVVVRRRRNRSRRTNTPNEELTNDTNT